MARPTEAQRNDAVSAATMGRGPVMNGTGGTVRPERNHIATADTHRTRNSANRP